MEFGHHKIWFLKKKSCIFSRKGCSVSWKKFKCSSLFPIIFMIFLKNFSQVETLDITGDPLITLGLNKLLERACLFKIQRGGFVSLCLWGTSALCVQPNSNGTWSQLLPNFMHFLPLIFIQFKLLFHIPRFWTPTLAGSDIAYAGELSLWRPSTFDFQNSVIFSKFLTSLYINKNYQKISSLW